MNMGSMPSLADIAAVTGNRNGDDGFGGNNGWWVLIILFALFNRGGFGYGDNGSNGQAPSGSFIEATIQRGFDNQSVINKLNGLENGICNLGYDQLNQMNQLGGQISNLGYQMQSTAYQNEIASLQRSFNQQSQVKDCCCNIENLLANAQYQRATDTCAITTAISNSTRDIVDNQDRNARAILDYLCNAENQRMRDENFYLKLSASQERQNNYLTATLNPQARPCYVVPNPNTGCCGYGNAGWYNQANWGFGPGFVG